MHQQGRHKVKLLLSGGVSEATVLALTDMQQYEVQLRKRQI